MLVMEDETIRLYGQKNVRIFKKGAAPAEFGVSDDLSFLLR